MAWGRSAGRPSLFPFGVSVILKSDSDMTKEEAKERFGDNIINKLLSLGAEPTNVCRNDDIVEWCSDGCIKVGDIEVWAYYYFYGGKDICVGDKKCKRVKIYVGRALADTPKTYKQIGGFVAKELSNAYNSGCVSIYEAKDKTLRYSVYRDGCFYPYYGKLEIIE